MAQFAVLTGDIVGSQRLEAGGLDLAFQGLADAGARLHASTGHASHLTRTRGDGWQAVTQIRYALRAAFLFRAGVRQCGKAFETRLGLGFGAGEIRGDTLEDAEGPAFVQSGHALDRIPKARRIVGTSQDLGVALPLADRVSGLWTPKQAEIALRALGLPKPTHEDVAQDLGITRQAVQQQWDAAHLDAICESCSISEEPT